VKKKMATEFVGVRIAGFRSNHEENGAVSKRCQVKERIQAVTERIKGGGVWIL